MTSQTNTPEGFVKKETLWLVAVIALAAGFLVGVVFSAFKSPAGTPQPPQQAQQQSQQQPQNNAPDNTAKIMALEQEVLKDPGNTAAWTQLGHFYFDGNKFEKAITAYTKSLELDPNNADVLTDLGVMYRRSGDPQKAVEAFAQASKINPDHPTALFNRGIVLISDLNDKEGALKTWEELVRRHPDAKAPNGQLVSEIITSVRSEP